MTNQNYQALLNALEIAADEDCLAQFGLRQTDGDFEVGQSLENSFVWVDGEITDEELDGVCTMGISYAEEKYLVEAIKNLGRNACEHFGVESKKYHTYSGKTFLLVQGDGSVGGEDLGEVIIKNPVVVAVFKM